MTYYMESWYMKQIGRMESQRTRLLEDLEKNEDTMKRLAIEKMVLDIDNKIMQAVMKIDFGKQNMLNKGVTQLNNWAKEQKLDVRYIEERSLIKTSTKTRDKIIKLIQEDRKNKNGMV